LCRSSFSGLSRLAGVGGAVVSGSGLSRPTVSSGLRGSVVSGSGLSRSGAFAAGRGFASNNEKIKRMERAPITKESSLAVDSQVEKKSNRKLSRNVADSFFGSKQIIKSSRQDMKRSGTLNKSEYFRAHRPTKNRSGSDFNHGRNANVRRALSGVSSTSEKYTNADLIAERTQGRSGKKFGLKDQQTEPRIYRRSPVYEARRTATVRRLPVNVSVVNSVRPKEDMAKDTQKENRSQSRGGISASEAADIVLAGGDPESVVYRSQAGSLKSSSPGDSEECGSDSPAATLAKLGSIAGANSNKGLTTSDLLDLIDWINKVVDDRLRDDFQRYGWESQRRQF
jgi:hypothetical protein